MSETNPHFFYKTIPCKGGRQSLIDKEMKRLCYLGILKEGFSPNSNPIMFISRKLTKDKRVVTDFRHLNVRIAKNNLAYPLLKDTFSVLGSSKCWSTISPRFKRCIPFSKIIRKFHEILWYTPIFWQHIIPISKNVYGIKHIPLHMAIIHHCYPWLFTYAKILWSHYGWFSIVYTN